MDKVANAGHYDRLKKPMPNLNQSDELSRAYLTEIKGYYSASKTTQEMLELIISFAAMLGINDQTADNTA